MRGYGTMALNRPRENTFLQNSSRLPATVAGTVLPTRSGRLPQNRFARCHAGNRDRKV